MKVINLEIFGAIWFVILVTRPIYARTPFLQHHCNHAIAWLNAPINIRKMNGWAVIIWLTFMLPTVTDWKTSVLWVAILSIWANIISHYTAWLAERVEVRAEHVEGTLNDQPLKADVTIMDVSQQKPGAFYLDHDHDGGLGGAGIVPPQNT